MPLTDLPQHQLARYRSPEREPSDLDAFWSAGVAETRRRARAPDVVARDEDVFCSVRLEDVSFSGADGDPVRAWLWRPRDGPPRGALVVYVGYGGGRGVPDELVAPATAGLAVLVMDNRAQGGIHTPGATADPFRGTGPEHPGVLTRGLDSPHTHYLRRLYLDAVRALETALQLTGLDPSRVAVAGRSQGGALAIAAATLGGHRPAACYADMPFLCDVRRGVSMASEGPYLELLGWFRQHPDRAEAALEVLAYFDVVHLAARLRSAAFLSVGLMDPVCPPSGVYAAFNAAPKPKELQVLPFHAHDGGGPDRVAWRLRHFVSRLQRDERAAAEAE